jgi:SAM-dependent methyltransferase
MEKNMKWEEFYRGRLLDKGYQEYVSDCYAPFIQRILGRIKLGDRVIEAGCGLATITSILTERRKIFCGFRCFDICPNMVEYAKITLGDISPTEGYPVDIGDARYPTGRFPDIVHSHGMLEHLNDDDIRKVIDASRKDGARFAIHYVPGEKYQKPSFGDERLMSVAAWKDIANPTDIVTFNDDHDYILEWDFR